MQKHQISKSLNDPPGQAHCLRETTDQKIYKNKSSSNLMLSQIPNFPRPPFWGSSPWALGRPQIKKLL